MQKYFVFIQQEWMLFLGLAAVVALLLLLENRRSGKKLSIHALTNLVNAEAATIIDLREKADFDNGHIVHAVNMPFSSLLGGQKDISASAIAEYKEKPLVLVCKMGQHSSQIARKLQSHGFTDVYRLGGGLLEWQNAQMPLIKS